MLLYKLGFALRHCILPAVEQLIQDLELAVTTVIEVLVDEVDQSVAVMILTVAIAASLQQLADQLEVASTTSMIATSSCRHKSASTRLPSPICICLPRATTVLSSTEAVDSESSGPVPSSSVLRNARTDIGQPLAAT